MPGAADVPGTDAAQRDHAGAEALPDALARPRGMFALVGHRALDQFLGVNHHGRGTEQHHADGDDREGGGDGAATR